MQRPFLLVLLAFVFSVALSQSNTTGDAVQQTLGNGRRLSLCSAGHYGCGLRCCDCGAGSYSVKYASDCTQCNAGTFSGAIAGSCTDCPAGSFSNAGAGSCTLCPAGRYSTAVSSPACSLCGINTYSTLTGSTTGSVCLTCPAGLYALSGSSVCVTAAPTALPTTEPTKKPTPQPSAKPSSLPTTAPSAKPSAAPTVKPSSCPTVAPSIVPSPLPSAKPTVACIPGTYYNGATCSNCAAGSFTSTIGNTACSACAIGTYTSVAAATTCTTCLAGLTTLAVGQTVCVTPAPSPAPTAEPTRPSPVPTPLPTLSPTGQPSSQPSSSPSHTPQPSALPSVLPSALPSPLPTKRPTKSPSGQPTSRPSRLPSSQPSSLPTTPTSQPTGHPSSSPTAFLPSQAGDQVYYQYHAQAGGGKGCSLSSIYKIEINSNITKWNGINRCQWSDAAQTYVSYKCKMDTERVGMLRALYQVVMVSYQPSDVDCLQRSVRVATLESGSVCQKLGTGSTSGKTLLGQPVGGYRSVRCDVSYDYLVQPFTYVNTVQYGENSCGRKGGPGVNTTTIINVCAPVYSPQADGGITSYRKLTWLSGTKSAVVGIDTVVEMQEDTYATPDNVCQTEPVSTTKRFYATNQIDKTGPPHCFRDPSDYQSFYLHTYGQHSVTLDTPRLPTAVPTAAPSAI